MNGQDNDGVSEDENSEEVSIGQVWNFIGCNLCLIGYLPAVFALGFEGMGSLGPHCFVKVGSF